MVKQLNTLAIELATSNSIHGLRIGLLSDAKGTDIVASFSALIVAARDLASALKNCALKL